MKTLTEKNIEKLKSGDVFRHEGTTVSAKMLRNEENKNYWKVEIGERVVDMNSKAAVRQVLSNLLDETENKVKSVPENPASQESSLPVFDLDNEIVRELVLRASLVSAITALDKGDLNAVKVQISNASDIVNRS